MKAVVALIGIFLMLIGRVCTYRVARAAARQDGSAPLGERIKASPRLQAWYRFGQSHYLMGVAAFVAAFFL